MNCIRSEKLVLPCCKLHRNNPFPVLNPQFPADRYEKWKTRVSPELGRFFGYGARHHPLPYPLQDGYGRERELRELDSIVLENNRMKAIFLPDFGARLWSLYDKQQKREVFYRNEVFQEGNLAVCNAWFSGGAEWNFGVFGHTPLTASPFYAAKLHNDDQQEVLRFYEYERIREIPYQLDFFFPDENSPLLCLHVRIANVDPVDKPIYYWSNLAFPDSPGTRVLVDAKRAMITSEFRAENDFPYTHGSDFSYSQNIPKAVDLFFLLDRKPGERSFEAVVDAGGHGLVSIASPLIEGRKLFVWGNSTGGRHWQRMLSDGEKPYLEIQTGRGKTQLESRRLPAESECSWMEIFAPFDLPAESAGQQDYGKAVSAAHEAVETLLSAGKMQALEQAASAVAQRKIEQMLHCGSGWGALECRRRREAGEAPFPESMSFPEACMGDLQKPFLDCLEHRLPEECFVCLPAWQCSEKWQPHFQTDSVFSCYQRAIFAYTRSDYTAAIALAGRALDLAMDETVKVFLRRFIARTHFLAGDSRTAAALFQELLSPDSDFQLFTDSFECFKATNQLELFAKKLAGAKVPPEFAGRRQLMLLQAALAGNHLEEAEAIIEKEFTVIDLREGELALEELYLELQSKKLAKARHLQWDQCYHDAHKNEFTVPAYLDFRMIPEEAH